MHKKDKKVCTTHGRSAESEWLEHENNQPVPPENPTKTEWDSYLTARIAWVEKKIDIATRMSKERLAPTGHHVQAQPRCTPRSEFTHMRFRR